MKKKRSGLTRQGVRDLNSLPSKSAGRKLPEPPKQSEGCKHVRLWNGICDDCGLDLTTGPKTDDYGIFW